jgi:hypothetical protein
MVNDAVAKFKSALGPLPDDIKSYAGNSNCPTCQTNPSTAIAPFVADYKAEVAKYVVIQGA